MKFAIILACLLAVAYAGNEDHRAIKSSERGHMMSRQHGDHHSGRGSHHTGRVSHHQGSGKMNMGGHRWARSAEDQEAEEDGHRVMSNKNQGSHSGSWMGGQRKMEHGSWMGGNRNMEHGSWKSVDRNMEHGSHSGSMKMSSGMKHGDNRSGKMNMGGHRWARSAEDQEAQEDGHRMMSNKNQGGHSGSWMSGQRNMEYGSWKSVDHNMEHGSHSGNMKMSSGMKHGDNRWGRHLDQDEEEQGSLIWGHPQLGHGRRHLGGNNRWSRYHI